MPFQIPALLTVTIDCLILVFYFDFPVYFNDAGHSISSLFISKDFSLLQSNFALVILAGMRLVFFLPYVWYYNRDAPITWPSGPRFWLFCNLLFLVIRLSILFVSQVKQWSFEKFQLLVLLISIVSTASQYICLLHLKTSAVDRSRIETGNQWRRKSLSHGSPLKATLQYKQESSAIDMLYNSNVDQDASPIPKSRIFSTLRRLSEHFVKGDSNNDDTVFGLIMDLFVHGNIAPQVDNSSDMPSLESLRNRIHTSISNKTLPEIKFFIPQISIYILHSVNVALASEIQESMFRMCKDSLGLAHRWHWFLNAFYLKDPTYLSMDTVTSIQEYIKLIESHGQIAAAKMAQGPSANKTQSNKNTSKRYGINSNNNYSSNINGNNNEMLGYSQEGMDSDEEQPHQSDFHRNASQYQNENQHPQLDGQQLLTKALQFLHISPSKEESKHAYMRVKSHDHTSSSEVLGDYDRVSEDFVCSMDDDWSSMMRGRGQDNDNDIDGNDITRKNNNDDNNNNNNIAFGSEVLNFPTLPMPESMERCYHLNITFWEKMCDLTRKVSTIPKSDRRGVLHDLLGQEMKELLPSACLYAPVGNDHHRIWSIVIDECFAFSTKSRAPVLLCLEVVDFAVKRRRRRRSWWSLGLPKGLKNFRSSLGSIMLPPTSNDPSSELYVSPTQKRRARHSYGGLDHNGLHQGTQDGIFRTQSPVIAQSRDVDMHDRNDINDLQDSSRTNSPVDWLDTHRRGGRLSLSHQSNNLQGEESPLLAKDHTRESREQTPRRRESSRDFHIIDVSDGNTREGVASILSDSLRTSEMSQSGTESDRCHHENNDSNNNSNSISNLKTSTANDDDDDDTKPVIVFQELWRHKEERIRETSTIGHLPGWRLLPVIVKTGDDLRQEQIVSQIIAFMHHILIEGEVDCWLRPYDVIAFSDDTGLIEAVPDTLSLDALKKSYPSYATLREFFEGNFVSSEKNVNSRAMSRGISLETALESFAKSLATYSVVCYLLQIKDRHNGNILIDCQGHIIHIDFGFVLGITPGGNMGFEKAPFKLTAEMVQVMGGHQSSLFYKFRETFVRVYMQLRKNHHRLLLALEIIARSNEHLPCFASQPSRAIEGLRQRFLVDMHDSATMEVVHSLIDESMDNWTTTCYDRYQRCCVGIF